MAAVLMTALPAGSAGAQDSADQESKITITVTRTGDLRVNGSSGNDTITIQPDRNDNSMGRIIEEFPRPDPAAPGAAPHIIHHYEGVTRSVVVNTRAGDDRFYYSGNTNTFAMGQLRDLRVTNPSGDLDSQINPWISGDLVIRGGRGAENIEVRAPFADDITVSLGAGNDQFIMRQGWGLDRVSVNMASGNDDVQILAAEILGSTRVTTTTGDDRVTINGSTLGRNPSISTSRGNDVVELLDLDYYSAGLPWPSGATTVGRVRVNMSHGSDTFRSSMPFWTLYGGTDRTYDYDINLGSGSQLATFADVVGQGDRVRSTGPASALLYICQNVDDAARIQGRWQEITYGQFCD